MEYSFTSLLVILSSFLQFYITLISGQCLQDQQLSLLELKQNLKFDPSFSTKLITWNSSTDCCHWHGVTCDDGRIVGLDLSEESIEGGVDNSSRLFDLLHLESLNLAFTGFDGINVPSGFSKLVHLRYPNMSYAGFAGQIPIEISRLKNLIALDLSSDPFYYSGVELKLENPKLATLVQNLTQLEELHLDGTDISAQGKDWCQALSSSLPNLRVLSLSNSFLSSPFHPSLAKLQSLSEIRLDGNSFSAPVPEFCANLSNLRILRLSDCGLQGTFPDDLHNSTLTKILLSNTKFSGRLPLSIDAAVNLSRIDVGYCSFTGKIPASMENLTQLLYLDLTSKVQESFSSRSISQSTVWWYSIHSLGRTSETLIY